MLKLKPWKWAPVFMLALVLIFAGCSANGNTPQNGQENKNPGNGETTYPEEVTAAVEALKGIKAGTSVTTGDKTYVIMSFGEQPTEGYQGKITGINEKDGKLVAAVRLEEPEGPAATVLTYPYAVKSVPGTYEEVEFTSEQENYVPQVVGLEEPLQKPAYSSDNIKVFRCDPEQKEIAGMARVFEANINYQVQNEAGDVLDEGHVTAASAAPDWGYFKLNAGDRELPAGASQLVLYQASAKDGSMQDTVTIPLQ